ncbi:hypothetical protein OPKNFCMD_4590 [Methylobacterium crusticola]|uniref:Uncharacterized protein n=1 Tax=Methylobacterium crusticola TaxID=1697972 RepID=A0ABQ4R4R8_9HYPH|nr:hypothetical protein [Methylobacterium crusticola]GJD51831.1 hypothetical protein OPKNFCMD_4590 [Methylobacterium crusticola]
MRMIVTTTVLAAALVLPVAAQAGTGEGGRQAAGRALNSSSVPDPDHDTRRTTTR